MKSISFRYRNHPLDLFRNTDTLELPNPEEKFEDFLVQFLPHFQSDNRVAFVDDLYKLLHNEIDEVESDKFIKNIGINKNEQEIKEKIKLIEEDLIKDAYQNFYSLVLTNKIEIIENDKRQ
jgi:hypothetical protein